MCARYFESNWNFSLPFTGYNRLLILNIKTLYKYQKMLLWEFESFFSNLFAKSTVRFRYTKVDMMSRKSTVRYFLQRQLNTRFEMESKNDFLTRRPFCLYYRPIKIFQIDRGNVFFGRLELTLRMQTRRYRRHRSNALQFQWPTIEMEFIVFSAWWWITFQTTKHRLLSNFRNVSNTRVAVSAEIMLHSPDTFFYIYSIKPISHLNVYGNEFYKNTKRNK